MIEKHPFGDFVPKNSEYLLVGSFTGKIDDLLYDWYYVSKRNKFWPIMSEVYGVKLQNKEAKQNLFRKLKFALTDIILSCERQKNSNLDMNLKNIVINEGINNILIRNKIKKVFFSSRFVEKLFKKYFKNFILNNPEVELVTLPSPSPRYAAMRLDEKIKRYKEVLPKIKTI